MLFLYLPCVFASFVGDTSAIRISLKLATGKAIVRRYLTTDSVRVLFAVAAAATANDTTDSKAAVIQHSSQPFDLMRSFPLTSLSEGDSLEKTLGEMGLAGSQVIMRWK